MPDVFCPEGKSTLQKQCEYSLLVAYLSATQVNAPLSGHFCFRRLLHEVGDKMLE